MSMKTPWLLAGLFLSSLPMAVTSGQADAAEVQNAPQGPNPERIYAALDTAEWQLSFRDPDTGIPRVGVNVLEKSVGGLLCRKTSAVVPEPVPRYQCFVQLTLSAGQAMSLFQLLNVRALDVGYRDPLSGLPRLGVKIMEKATDDLICQSVAAVIPEPVPSYSCYTDISDDVLRREKRHTDRDWRERH